MPRFEFDPAKCDANLAKHGIDFIEAQAIWTDGNRIEIRGVSVSELRFLMVGMARGKLWSAAITYRGETIRIISVRRARFDERRRYYEQIEKENYG
jgi:hypothetical protein